MKLTTLFRADLPKGYDDESSPYYIAPQLRDAYASIRAPRPRDENRVQWYAMKDAEAAFQNMQSRPPATDNRHVDRRRRPQQPVAKTSLDWLISKRNELMRTDRGKYEDLADHEARWNAACAAVTVAKHNAETAATNQAMVVCPVCKEPNGHRRRKLINGTVLDSCEYCAAVAGQQLAAQSDTPARTAAVRKALHLR